MEKCCIYHGEDCLVPYGTCHCGCGAKTRPALQTTNSLGLIKGMPMRYLPGHRNRRQISDAGAEPAPEPGMRFIPLTQGQWARIREHRYAELSQFTWHAWWCKHSQSYYAFRSERIAGKKISIAMHRQILGLVKGDTRYGDHINRDTLDNSDENLRIATPSNNLCNRGPQRNNATGFKGVSYVTKGRDKGKYVAQIHYQGRYYNLGRYAVARDAALAYDAKAIELHGEFAHLNFTRTNLPTALEPAPAP